MNDIQATLRAALTLYASHISDMQRAADTVSPSDNVRMDEILAARSRVEGMRKDLAEAFAHVHAMRAADESHKATTEFGNGRVFACDSQGRRIIHDFPPGFIGWLHNFAWLAVSSHLPTPADASRYVDERMRAAGWIQ